MAPGDVQTARDIWGIVEVVSTAFGVVLVPVVVGIVGHWISKRIARREIEAETMKLAVAILESEKTDEDVKKWAVEVLDRYSGVPIGAEARSKLTSGPLRTRREPTTG